MPRTVIWDIDTAIIAVNNGNGTYGSPVVVAGVVSLNANLRVKTGEQPGDGGVYEVRSKPTAISGTLSFADNQAWEVMQVITGTVREGSGAYYALPFDSDEFGYFAISGKTSLEGSGSFELFIPRCKITSDISIGMQDSNFTVPELSFTAVPDANFTRTGKPQIVVPIRRNADIALAIPPTSIAVS